MIQLEKPVLTGTMPVVWPTILDLSRDECKRILRKLGKNSTAAFIAVLLAIVLQLDWRLIMIDVCFPELEAYAGVISALRAQGDLTKDKKDLLAELNKILGYVLSPTTEELYCIIVV